MFEARRPPGWKQAALAQLWRVWIVTDQYLKSYQPKRLANSVAEVQNLHFGPEPEPEPQCDVNTQTLHGQILIN